MNCYESYDRELLKIIYELRCVKLDPKSTKTEYRNKRNCSEEENGARTRNKIQSPIKKYNSFRTKYHTKPEF